LPRRLRALHPAGFVEASHELNLTMGAINTAVLICSSRPMLAVAPQMGSAERSWLSALISLGRSFWIKAVEYHEKFVSHHVPGPSFHSMVKRVISCACLYFAMTGLHALI
jgi:cytochrome c oxidase subunit 3